MIASLSFSYAVAHKNFACRTEYMNLKRCLPFILFLSFCLVACRGGSGTAPTPSSEAVAQQSATDANVLDLPAEVNVQTVANIRERDDVFLLDVREQWEYDAGHLSNITHIPMGDVPNRLNEIPTDKTVIVYCASGVRSGNVRSVLFEHGYTKVHNMQGGIVAWQRAGLPIEK